MKLQDITNARCKERLANLLREKIGAGKDYTVIAAADALDITPRVLRSYMDGENLPQMPVLMKMLLLFGSSFANRLLRLANLDGCFSQEVDPITDHELNADACLLVGELGRALRRGKIDHRCRPEIIHEVQKLIPALQDWLMANDPLGVPDMAEKPAEFKTQGHA